MKIHRPLWFAGALLCPQQFQQQARWEARTNESVARLALAHPWGVAVADFDTEALRLGTLKATRLLVRLPDGTLVDSELTDCLPPALALDRLQPDSQGRVTLVLALPLMHANGGNCLLDGMKADRPLPVLQEWHKVQDLYGDDLQEIGVLQHNLSLRLASDDNQDCVTCPLLRLVRDGQGEWSLDGSFVPPLLNFSAHAGLVAQLDNLLIQLSAKRQRLMGMRRESNQRMADFAVADVSLFWLLNALNSCQPVLMDLKAHPRHPEQVYQELVKLAGSLLTFSLEHDLDQLPAYRHDQLEQVFAPLMQTISTLLEASLPSRVIALELEVKGSHRWQVSLNDPRLCEPGGADFYLSVRCRLPAVQLQEQFPRLCKVGVPDDVDQLVNSALDGVPLQPLGHVPAAIPLRLENQYFALDFSHPKGREVLASQVFALYVPGSLGEVKLELFAVLRS
ncbi:type VI secretion system baseplate subunit TssK [Pseudomonas sp. zfem002]|uniref:type VI secretion system baseplate subunit TssK n=1 Tax=Pseudomonas sp. zfem002 TaxID=3078197 RepID=UPI00292840E2|nr:type VI secretion system baseplate subunit TssK [Pseudomonas sp. zfem002]MDU9393629.1 type VI secretion system baseplate subunit TssK [Pseudomonas sp. zfem002]